MKFLLFVPLLAFVGASFQQPDTSSRDREVVVVEFKWSKSHEIPKQPDPAQNAAPAPQREVIPANKVWARDARANNPPGATDPNDQTIDGRSAAIEKIVQEARTRKAQGVDSYAYLAKIQNNTQKAIEIVFWEYDFIDKLNAQNTTRHQFLCGVNVKPNKEKELHAFSLNGPNDVVSASLAGNSPDKSYSEKVLINRIEFADGSIWQRKDWNGSEIKLTYQRAIATPWTPGEMCRGL